MSYEQRENSGSLFNNDRKEKPNQPDLNGSAMIGGQEFWVSGWRKESASGKKFLSLAFTVRDAQRGQQGGTTRRQLETEAAEIF